jgi:hypothetical protein
MIVDGRLTRKYDMMLVDLRNAGGDYEWIRDGEDGVAATIRIHWKDRSHEYTYTMEMAKKRGLYDRNPNYKSQPGNMLRSKAVRESFRMYCPEVIGGCLTLEDAVEISSEESSAELERQAAEIRAAAKAPTQQSATPATAPSESQQEEEVPFQVEKPDAREPAKEQEQKPETASNGNGKVTREQLQILIAKAKQIPTKNGPLTGPQIKAHICKETGVSDPEEMTPDQCGELISRIDAKLAEINSKN